ncbi:MAG: site-specific DNA-methyltransferase [Paludibacteraceae bacterium]|nr:site-specific DNA-methyltransferase [Paludibacteraceae bacterium]
MAKLTNERKSQLRKTIAELEGLSAEDKSTLIELLNTHKKYGLVWEDKPEDVEEAMRDHLPLLTEVKERAILSDSPEAPNHILIEGDNLEALTALSYTHEGKIDVIYIDPPYNTGNKDFIYNDSFVDSEDAYRHSKWLSFMNKRLKIAKRLLSERGVIFISIDDNEQANLKLLCDEIFGSVNFVANMIWRGGKRNAAKWISTSHEYMILYAKNINYCNEHQISWKENKKGLKEIYQKANELVCENNNDYEKASYQLKKWYKSLSEEHECKAHEHYCWIDATGVYFASDISRGGGGGPKWDIVNPQTNNLVSVPSRGWAYSKKEDLLLDIENGLIHFNGDGVPCKKRYLKDNETQLVETVFYKDRRGSSKRLRNLMGEDLFPFPKDEFILKDKFAAFSDYSSIILDFFAGSGTTLHATMQLNAEDGGNRKCILVTNNENNICEKVTYERNKRVINGYTTPKGEKVEGLKNNSLRYYKTTLMSRERTQRNMRALVAAATELLCVKEDLYEEKTVFGQYMVNPRLIRYFDDGERRMLVIYREEVIDEVVVEIEKMEYDGKMKIYLFAPGRYAFDDNFYPVHEKVTLCALPAAIYDAYEKVLPKHKIADDPSRDTACCVLDEQSELGQQKYVEQKLFSNEGGEQ